MSATARREAPEVATSELSERAHARFLWAVVALLAVGLWLWPMRSSLWTDELGTWWVIKDGFGDAIDRAMTFHGQSPLFYVLLGRRRHVVGRSEVALRLPSLLAAAGAAAITFVLVRRLANDEAARLTTVAFVGIGGSRSPRRTRDPTRSASSSRSPPALRSSDGSMREGGDEARCSSC